MVAIDGVVVRAWQGALSWLVPGTSGGELGSVIRHLCFSCSQRLATPLTPTSHPLTPPMPPKQGMMRQFAGRKALWDAAVDCMAQLDALMSLVGGDAM